MFGAGAFALVVAIAGCTPPRPPLVAPPTASPGTDLAPVGDEGYGLCQRALTCTPGPDCVALDACLSREAVDAFNREVCASPAPLDATRAEAEYVRARVHASDDRWEVVALGLRDVAINAPNQADGARAGRLYLEALQHIASRSQSPLPSCHRLAAADAMTLIELYCSGGSFEDNLEECLAFVHSGATLERLDAENLVRQGDRLEDEGASLQAIDLYRRGADAYLAIWRTYCEQPLAHDEQPKECEKADRLLYDMAQAYQAGHLFIKAVQARHILINPRHGLHRSPLASMATYELGGAYEAIGMFDRAVEYYEKYARDTQCRGEFAARALGDATILALALGDADRALVDAQACQRVFGERSPDQAVRVALALAAHHEQEKDWPAVVARLHPVIRLIDSAASVDERAQAHRLLARAHAHLQRDVSAVKEYEQVLDLWNDPQAAAAAIEALDEPRAARARRLGCALDAVGEALFFFAERGRAKLEAATPVASRIAADGSQRGLESWVRSRGRGMKTVEASYRRIVDLQPMPAPRWVVAAAASVGQMWSDSAAALRVAASPQVRARRSPNREAPRATLDASVEPWMERAKGAMETCVSFATRYQRADAHSRACEDWLGEHYPDEWHVLDELYDAPNRIDDPLRARTQPLLRGGLPIDHLPPAR